MAAWSVRTKLASAFGSLTFAVLLIAGLSLNSLGDANQNFAGYISGISARADAAQAVQAAVARRALAMRDMLFADVSERSKVMQTGMDAQRDVATNLDRLNALAKAGKVPVEVQTMIDTITRIEGAYGPIAVDSLRLGEAGNTDAEIKKIREEGRPLLISLQQATDAYMTLTRRRESAAVKASQAAFEWHRNVLLLICLVSALGAGLAGFVITRSLTRQLGAEPGDLRLMARDVARGNLSVIRNTKPVPEGSVSASMEDMRRSLITLVEQVRMSAQGISAGSSEIAQGNLDLSSRTEQQAASLQETSSSMEELTTTVRQNASHAQQANTMASNASDVAARGTTMAREVAHSMHEISENSKKIEAITSIIEGIAFQTNILALNAAVEAARAGEEGRGFAVVASEVRSLAHRSASASKEIKTLISASVSTINRGHLLATQGGTTMDEVAKAVANVTALISEIASASDEQSRGIAMVNVAISQMDKVTQQNAALVEEASAASQALESQGRQLINAISSFDVENR